MTEDLTPFEELSIEERKDRSLKAVSNFAASLANDLKAYEPFTELVKLDNGDYDLLLEGQYLYEGTGCTEFTQKQLDNFWKSPQRISTGLVSGEGFDWHTQQFANNLKKTIEENDITIDPAYHQEDSYFTIILGIGLGQHLLSVIEKTTPRIVLILDRGIEYLHQSLHVTDWQAIVDHCRANDIMLAFGFDAEQALMERRMSHLFRHFNPTALDGTYIYAHIKDSSVQKTLRNFFENSLKVGMMGLGFFEDEMHMLANTIENFRGDNVRTLRRMPNFHPYPAFIVGNGPSLDKNIDFIRENQDKALILACGSALDPLLLNGIYPDFLFMLERAPKLVDDQVESAKIADISDIVFVGASNLFAGVTAFHKDKILFWRPGLSPRPIFQRNNEETPPNADPMVANAGLAFSFSAGFSEIYFFGVDAGSRFKDKHHSKFSQYTTRNIPFNFEFNNFIRGNFGGTVASTDILLWSKKSLEDNILSHGGGRRIYNCSDGALIRNAVPRLPETLDLEPIGDKKAIVRDLIDGFPMYTREDMEAAWERADVFNRLDKMADDLVACMNDGLYDMRYMTKMMNFLRPAAADDGIAMIYRGTLFNSIFTMQSYLRRVENEDDRPVAEEAFRKCMTDFIYFLRDEANTWLTNAIEGNHDLNLEMEKKRNEAEEQSKQ